MWMESSRITTGTINKKINLICDSLLILSSDSIHNIHRKSAHNVWQTQNKNNFIIFFFPFISTTYFHHNVSRWSKHLTIVSFIFKSFLLFHLLSFLCSFALYLPQNANDRDKAQKTCHFPYFCFFVWVFLLSRTHSIVHNNKENAEYPYQL